jgi:4-hydroxybenzoate polyprenyltransferase
MSFYQAISKLPARIIAALEDNNIPFLNYILTFFAAILLRHFFEAYSQAENYFNLPTELVAVDLLHYTLSYITLALLLIGVLYYAVRIKIEQIARVVLPSFILLLLSPLLDLLLTLGEGVSILYLQPGYDINLLHTYLTFFGGFTGVSAGIRIEIALVLIGIFFYCLNKQLTILLSLVYTWICYTVIFLWGAAPYFVQWIKQLTGFAYTFTGISMIHFYLVVTLLLAGMIFFLANKSLLMALIKDMRALRIFYYIIMLLLGAVLALCVNPERISTQIYFYDDILINLLLASIAIGFSCLFSLMMNNTADVAIDCISNPDRPFVSGAISPIVYTQLTYVFGSLALFYAAMVNAKTFLIIVATMASYYIYSMSPIRFKRVTVFSKLTIAFNSLALVVLGFLLVQHDLSHFPNSLFIIILIGFTLAANVIDIKDTAGDKAAGILTLPVLLGEQQAKYLIAVAFFLTYVSFFLLVPNYYLLPLMIVGGLMQCYFILRKPYREWMVLALNNISIIFLMGYLIMEKVS